MADSQLLWFKALCLVKDEYCGERQILDKMAGCWTQVVIKAGMYISLFWFVDLGNACLFTSGSPVERTTVIFC